MTAQLDDPEYLSEARGTLPGTRGFKFSPAELRLLALAGLPLVDGVFASIVAGGTLFHPANLPNIAYNIFSGAGCIGVAATLDGHLVARMLTVLKVYGIVLLGALVEAFGLPFVAPLITPDLKPYGAIVLLGVAVALSGLPVAPTGALPQTCAARWAYSLRLLAVPQVILAMLAAISVLHIVSSGLRLGATVAPATVLYAGIAVLMGLGLTLTATVVADFVQRWVELAVLRLAGSAALVVIALQQVGMPVPASVPLPIVPVPTSIPLLILLGGLAVAVPTKRYRTVLAKRYGSTLVNVYLIKPLKAYRRRITNRGEAG